VTAALICNFDTLGRTRPEAAIDGANWSRAAEV